MADTIHTWTPALSDTSAPTARKSGLHRFMRRRSTIAFLMCLPLIVIICGLIIYPALYSIYLVDAEQGADALYRLVKFHAS